MNIPIGVSGSVAIIITSLVSKVLQKGIFVEYIGKAQESDETIVAVIRGDIQLVYVYQFVGEFMIQSNINVIMKAVVIDEARCIKIYTQTL